MLARHALPLHGENVAVGHLAGGAAHFASAMGAWSSGMPLEVTRLVDTLEPHKMFFTSLKSAGGRGSVIIQFLGDGYLADEIPHATLVKLVALKLALAIECFADPQS
jgi:hypothetical protein